MIYRILTFHLAILLLVTNMGIPVFTHICHTQSKSWSSLYLPAKSCCSKKKHLIGSEPCHATENQQSQINRRPCCENLQGWLQLGVDFLQYAQKAEVSLKLVYANPINMMDRDSYVHVVAKTFISNTTHGPPLKLYGRSLLISQQVFRC